MNVLAFDLSLTATGVAHCDGRPDVLKTRLVGMDRLAWFREQVTHLVLEEAADVVMLEGYSMGTARQNSHAHALGELGGAVRLALWDLAAAYVEVPPASLKKFATGKGNDSKDAVLAAAVRNGFEGDDNNAADAFWLRQLGLYRYWRPDVPFTHYRQEAMVKVVWPDLHTLAAAS